METNTQTTYQRIDYLTCRKYLNNLGITDGEINTALDQLGITKRDLVDEIGFPKEHTTPYQKPHEFSKYDIIYYKLYNGEYEKSCTRKGSLYFVPAQYQGLMHGKIIYQILVNRYSWMDDFKVKKSYKESEFDEYFDVLGKLNVKKLPEEYHELTIKEILERNKFVEIIKDKSAWDLYEMSNENYEIYLQTENGSLYVSIKALLDKDFSIIEKRMLDYGNSYYDYKNLSDYALNHGGRTKEEYAKDKLNEYNKFIGALKSKEALKLKKLLS